MRHWIEINRAPVLTLWAAVVATCLGFDWEEALTLGRAVAGLNAYSKGKALGLFEPTPEAVKEKRRQLRREKGGVLNRLAKSEGPGGPYGSWHKSPSERSADKSGFGHELSHSCFRRRPR